VIMNREGVEDGEVYVTIRPEGFVPDENGPLCCELRGVEVMGRDVTVVSGHKAMLNTEIRSIVSTEYNVDDNSSSVRFSVMPHKVFLFHKETEERIMFESR